MRNRARAAAVVLFSLISVTIASCGSKVVEYQASYPSYESLEELYLRAALVIEARVGPPSRVQEMRPIAPGTDPRTNPGAGAPQAQQRAEDILVTTVRPAAVIRVYKGAAKAGETVEVGQLGGEYKGVAYRQSEVTALKDETTYLLFLEVFPDSPAVLLNPDQAQYTVDAAGQLVSLTDNPIRFTAADLDRISAKK